MRWQITMRNRDTAIVDAEEFKIEGNETPSYVFRASPEAGGQLGENALGQMRQSMRRQLERRQLGERRAPERVPIAAFPVEVVQSVVPEDQADSLSEEGPLIH